MFTHLFDVSRRDMIVAMQNVTPQSQLSLFEIKGVFASVRLQARLNQHHARYDQSLRSDYYD